MLWHGGCGLACLHDEQLQLASSGNQLSKIGHIYALADACLEHQTVLSLQSQLVTRKTTTVTLMHMNTEG